MSTILRIVALALPIAFLPGAIAFRAFARGRSRASLAAEERVFWYVVLSVLWSSVVGLALAAAGAYRFERLLWINAALCLLVAAVLRGRLRLGAEAPFPSRTALVPAALTLLGSLVFFAVPPAEYVMGGKDPGVYMNEGIQIAQRGGLVITDEVARSIRPEHRELFYPLRQDPSYYSIRFMGFFVLDPTAGTIVGQFPHLYPVWIAIAYGVNGLSGARWVIGLWAVLGLLAVYFAGARLWGRAAAAAGTGLLAVHVLQIWYARYPNGEMVMQPLVFAGLLAYVRAQRDGDRFFAPTAGLLLSLAIFAHITGVFAVAAIVLVAALSRCDGQRIPLTFSLPLIAGTGVAVLYLAVILPPYFALPLAFVRYLGALRIGILAAAGLAVVLAWRASARPAVATRLRATIPVIVAAVLWLAAGYAYFLRSAGGTLAPHDADALRTFTLFYLSPLGLAAALVGLMVVAWRSFWVSAPLIGTVAVFSLTFFYKIRIVPEHFWAGRRFVAVILPGLLLLVGAAAFADLGSSGRRAGLQGRVARLVRAAVGLIVVLALGWHFWQRATPIRRHVEYAGLIPRLERLASAFNDDDLVLVESRGVADTHVLALPLAYIYARNVLVLAPSVPDKRMLREFLTWAGTRYRRVIFMGGGGMEILSPSLRFASIGAERFWIPEYESPRNAYPRQVRLKEFDVGLYELGLQGDPIEEFDLDIGQGDSVYVRGFHAEERRPDGSMFRWTHDVASIAIGGAGPEVRRLTIWMGAGGRPPVAGAATARVSVDERVLGSVTVGPTVEPHVFAIPEDLAASISRSGGASRVQIVTTPWNPARLLAAKDDRELGVMIDRVTVGP